MKVIDDNIMVVTKQRERIRKDSLQAKNDIGGLWIEPRYDFDTLGTFFDYNSWHRRCILLKASVTCGLGWKLVSDKSDMNPDEEYHRIESFLMQPNKEMTFSQLALRSAVDYYHLGNIFTELVKNKKGELAEMFHAPAASMRVGLKPGTFWQIRYGKQIEFAGWDVEGDGQNRIAHLACYDPKGDYYGMPDWLPAMATMTLDRNAVSYNIYNFENELMAKVLLLIKGAKLDKDVRLKLKQFFGGQLKGLENSGKAVVIDVDDPNVGIDMLKLQQDAKDMSFLDGRQFNRDEVVQIHNVPPRILGIIAAGQLGGGGEVEGQLKIFKSATIAPHKREIEAYFNRILADGLGARTWRLEFDELDITTAVDDADYVGKVQTFITDDEARDILGYKPRKETKEGKRSVEENSGKDDDKEKTQLDLLKGLVRLRKILEREDDAEG